MVQRANLIKTAWAHMSFVERDGKAPTGNKCQQLMVCILSQINDVYLVTNLADNVKQKHSRGSVYPLLHEVLSLEQVMIPMYHDH